MSTFGGSIFKCQPLRTFSPRMLARHVGPVYISSTTEESLRGWAVVLDQFIASAESSSDQQLLSVLVAMRNSVIGSTVCKRILIERGFVKRLTAIVGSEAIDDARILSEASVVLGSLAYGNESDVAAIVQDNVPQVLIRLLTDLWSTAQKDTLFPVPYAQAIEAISRSLRNISRFVGFPRTILLEGNPPVMDWIVEIWMGSLVAAEQAQEGLRSFISTAEYLAVFLANCSQATEDDTTIQDALIGKTQIVPGFYDRLLSMLGGQSPLTLDAGLDLMAALTRDNYPVCQHLVKAVKVPKTGSSVPAFLFDLLLRSPRGETRLLASIILTSMSRVGVLAEDSVRVPKVLIPTLIGLLEEESLVKARAPLILSSLIADSDVLQVAAAECGAIPKLAAMLSEPVGNEQQSLYQAVNSTSEYSLVDQYIESALMAIAAIASLREECRRTVIDAKILPSIVAAMDSPVVGIRAAACQCARSLSRSVKNLRTSLLDVDIARPLLRLLADPHPNVRVTACASICNLVLDFSPMKTEILEGGGIEILIGMVNSDDGNLRLNALWALKNLLYQADKQVKAMVMEQLTYKTVYNLANDSDILVQEQALNLIRNLACNKDEEILQVFEQIGEERLIRLLEAKLASPKNEIVIQALYVIVNSSTGSARPKQLFMQSHPILTTILGLLSHLSSEVRTAAVWCIINLTWTDDPEAKDRVAVLCEMGFEERLKELQMDSVTEVRERVATALLQIEECRD